MRVPLRIEVESGERVLLIWESGEETDLTASQLRAACSCATCREPRGEAATAAVVSGREPVTIREAKLVGGYAMNFIFGPDDHGTGIFPYEALYELGRSSS